MSTSADKARQRAADLIAAAEVAEKIEAELDGFEFYLPDGSLTFLGYCSDKDEMAAATRALVSHGGAAVKNADDDYMTIQRTFAVAKVQVYATRSDVCERVQVGTEKVEKRTVVTPAVETVEEVEEPVYEWRCAPVLAAAVSS